MVEAIAAFVTALRPDDELILDLCGHERVLRNSRTRKELPLPTGSNEKHTMGFRLREVTRMLWFMKLVSCALNTGGLGLMFIRASSSEGRPLPKLTLYYMALFEGEMGVGRPSGADKEYPDLEKLVFEVYPTVVRNSHVRGSSSRGRRST